VNKVIKLFFLLLFSLASSVGFAELDFDCPTISEIQNVNFNTFERGSKLHSGIAIASTANPMSYGTSDDWYIYMINKDLKSLAEANSRLSLISSLDMLEEAYFVELDKNIRTCYYQAFVNPNIFVMARTDKLDGDPS